VDLTDRDTARLTVNTVLTPNLGGAIESKPTSADFLVSEILAAGNITADFTNEFLFLALTGSSGCYIRGYSLLACLGLESHDLPRLRTD
jgi:hypothetical protein